LIEHFVFVQSNSKSFKDIFYDLKQNNDPILCNNIKPEYLASYFQVTKKFLTKIEQEWSKLQREQKKGQ